MILVVIVAIVVVVLGGFALFVLATMAGTLVGIVGAIVQSHRLRAAARAAGTPYRKVTLRQAREERLARQAAHEAAVAATPPHPNCRADIPGARHQSGRQRAKDRMNANLRAAVYGDTRAPGQPLGPLRQDARQQRADAFDATMARIAAEDEQTHRGQQADWERAAYILGRNADHLLLAGQITPEERDRARAAVTPPLPDHAPGQDHA